MMIKSISIKRLILQAISRQVGANYDWLGRSLTERAVQKRKDEGTVYLHVAEGNQACMKVHHLTVLSCDKEDCKHGKAYIVSKCAHVAIFCPDGKNGGRNGLKTMFAL
jgi:hypothetical protein